MVTAEVGTNQFPFVPSFFGQHLPSVYALPGTGQRRGYKVSKTDPLPPGSSHSGEIVIA